MQQQQQQGSPLHEWSPAVSRAEEIELEVADRLNWLQQMKASRAATKEHCEIIGGEVAALLRELRGVDAAAAQRLKEEASLLLPSFATVRTTSTIVSDDCP